MNKNKKIFNLLVSPANALFVLLLLIVFLVKPLREVDSNYSFVFVILLIQLIYIVKQNHAFKKSATDIVCVTYAFLIFWEVMTKLNRTHPVLVPPPENVFHVFVTQRVLILEGLLSSLKLLITSMGLALLLGIAGGLLVGYIKRLREAIMPIARVINTIPPLVYTPYVVAVMPTFRAASIFVIFSAVFWPTFMSMVSRVGNIDKKILDSAKSMGLSTFEMLFEIFIPYSLPEIISRLSTSLTSAMLCLTGAEMLGANSGMGYFVKKYSDYADYTKVIAGIIFIGLVVSVLNVLVQYLEKKIIKWDY